MHKVQPADAMTSTDKSLSVQGVEVHVTSRDDEDYISLTDMTKKFDGADQLIKNWLQNKNTVDFLGVWETLNNPSFNLVEFHQIKNQAGLNRFVMFAKPWLTRTPDSGRLRRAHSLNPLKAIFIEPHP